MAFVELELEILLGIPNHHEQRPIVTLEKRAKHQPY